MPRYGRVSPLLVDSLKIWFEIAGVSDVTHYLNQSDQRVIVDQWISELSE